MPNIKEIKFEDFIFVKNNLIASYNVLGTFSPAVWKNNRGNYGIRIIKSKNYLNGSMEWDYFDLDEDGIIVSSPRGMAKFYTNKIKIVDIEEAIEKYKNITINQ